MRFSFPLEALLNWKRSLEESSQMRLAEIVTRLKVQEQEIEKLILKRLSHEEKLKEKSHRGIRVGEYLLYKQFAEDSRRDLLSKEEKKKRTLREIEEEREKLIALMKEKKILEKLKEKQFKSFLSQSEKAEQKQNDEIATLKYPSSSKKRTS
jgi:flagellar FliJ protein